MTDAAIAIENPLAAVLDASPDCFKVLSHEGRVLFVNRQGLALMEADSFESLRGTYYPDLWPAAMRQSVIDAINGAVAGAMTCVEGYCPTLKGAPRWWETQFNRIKSRPQNATEIIAVTRDISARRAREFKMRTLHQRAQSDLRRMAAELSEADRRTNEFIATLAHELRNPLAPIRTGLQLMRKAQGDTEAIGHVREMMERQLSQMVHLISDLLDIARVTSGKVALKKERIELHRVLQTAVEASASLIANANHSLTVDVPPEPLYVDGDATRLAQVFTNILNNAAKYTSSGGSIAVTVARSNAEVAIEIADTGIGIAAEELLPIFEMFTRVGRNIEGAQGGLGIGLNLVRRLVELHAGSVVARSEGLGKGSHFVVTLPLAPPSHDYWQAAEAPPQRSPAPRQGVRVLLVDDNVDAAASLSMLLQLAEHATQVANGGAEALRVIGEFKPDIVFLDIGMPGMNGYEVARAIRQMPEAGNPVLVALSGWGGELDRSRSRNAGFDEHLTKPADISTIEKLLAKLSQSGT